jgi:hypothetical protein
MKGSTRKYNIRVLSVGHIIAILELVQLNDHAAI